MAHLVENMFSVKETPWHGLGTVLQEAPTTADAIRLAGLDWTTELSPLFVHSIPTPTMPQFALAPAFATVRSTDRAILGVVGPKYHVLQNREAFAWFDPFVESGEATLETAGSLDGGRRVWIMAQLNRGVATIGVNDEVRKFLLLSNSHDGTLCVRVGFTPIRVVCANTLGMAHSSRKSNLLRVRHTKGMRPALDVIRDTVNAADAAFEASAEQFRFLASRRVVNRADLDRYVRIVLGMAEAPTGPAATKEAKAAETRSGNVIATVLERFDGAGMGATLPSSEGTWWGAYNAVAEFLSYERGRTDDSRLSSLWYGDSHAVLTAALDQALSMAT